MKLRKILFLVPVLIFSACTKAPKMDSPEGALQSYVVTAFEAKSPEDKKKLMALSTGEALFYLESMSDENFKKQFVDSKLKFVSLKAKDRREETSGDVSLVYELSFREGDASSPTVHTNKKIAYLTHDKEKGEWKIKATKNLKSFVERKEDLVVTPETTDQENDPAKK